MALTLKRKKPDGTEEEIGAETLWKERDELAALVAARDRELAEARAMWGREYQRALERADTAERALAEARGFLASVLDCVDQSNIERLCRLADTISDWLEGKLAARPAPPCDCGFPWGGGLTAPKRHANDCATRAEPPAPQCECGVWFDEAWEEQPKVHTHAPTCPAARPAPAECVCCTPLARDENDREVHRDFCPRADPRPEEKP